MCIPVTAEDSPELFTDPNHTWRKIGEKYFQSDTNQSTALEIRLTEDGKFTWWLYADNSPDPDMAVTMDDAPTLAEALADATERETSYREDYDLN